MLVDAVANLTLDRLLGDASGPLGATAYIGLMLTTPMPDGSSVFEPSGNGYARVAVANNSTQWPAAVARVKQHANDITFPVALGVWGNVGWVGVFDAPSGGNLRIYDALTAARVILATDQYRFLAGGANALKFTI